VAGSDSPMRVAKLWPMLLAGPKSTLDTAEPIHLSVCDS
jgi:hypothetical protein